ncbi:MAG TPA: copper amine oxidase N-terminal domain-containing protein [bacterium]|jgi:hypothetical protein
MRRNLAATLLIAALIVGVAPVLPAQAQTIRVLVDGSPISFDQPPAAIGGRVLVPLRGVFERLGAYVQWDPRTNTVSATKPGTTVQLQIGSRQAYVNGRLVTLDVPPMVVQGRTLVPLRFVSEAMGARVDWDPSARTVFITSGTVAQPPQPPTPAPPMPPVLPPAPPATPAVVEGTVFRVDTNVSPQRILVQREQLIYTFSVTADTAITQVDPDTGRGGSIALSQIRSGDLVRVTADTSNRAITIRVMVREVSGRIDAITARAIVLTDGRAFTFAEGIRFLLNGREVTRDQLRAGMDVTLRINPTTGLVSEVAAEGVGATPPPPAPGTVRIASVTQSATTPLRAGQRVDVTLQGTPGGTATFDIFGIVAGVAMTEASPGVYRGSYTVRAGETVVDAAIIGRLRVGSQEVLVAADRSITIDTAPPEITSRSPAPNANVNNARPNIVVRFEDEGAGIDPNATRLLVNGQNVTAAATISADRVSYNPPQPLSGSVRVEVRLVDKAGNQTNSSWTFAIAPQSGSLIQSVTVNPTTALRAGDTLTITVVGEPGARATFSIEGVAQNTPMTEAANQPGVYFGSYTAKPTDNVVAATITVQLTKGGRTSTAEASTGVTIVGQQPAAPTITEPKEGDRVGASFEIRGRATAGYRVVARIDYRGTALGVLALQGTYGEFSATVGREGNFRIDVNPRTRIPNAELTITVWVIDPAGRRSPPATVKVIQG